MWLLDLIDSMPEAIFYSLVLSVVVLLVARDVFVWAVVRVQRWRWRS